MAWYNLISKATFSLPRQSVANMHKKLIKGSPGKTIDEQIAFLKKRLMNNNVSPLDWLNETAELQISLDDSSSEMRSLSQMVIN